MSTWNNNLHLNNNLNINWNNNNFENGEINNWNGNQNNNISTNQLLSFSLTQLADTFCHAIEEENDALIQKMLENDVIQKNFINFVGNYEMTPLLFALKKSRFDIVEELLEKGADVNIPAVENFYDNEFGETPLLYMTYKEEEYTPAVEYLLEKGANVNYQDAAGYSALYNAASRGHSNIVQLLLAKGAKVDAETTRDKYIPLDKESSGWTPLMEACVKNHPTVVSQLLQAGANIQHKNMMGETPLILASRFGANDCISLLVKAGAKINEDVCVNVTGSVCYTPLMAACSENHADTVQQLLALGANVNYQNTTKKNSRKLTALIVAADIGSPEITQILLDAGADIYLKDKYGKTAIEITKNEQVKKILAGRERFNYARTIPFAKPFRTIPLNVHKRIANFISGPVNNKKKNVINTFERVRLERLQENAKRIGPKKFTRRFHKSKKAKHTTRRRNKH